jgi:hypothetical protein
MAFHITDIEQLEQFLLRRGVGALEADRDRCYDCGRTPLTGEHVHIYGAPARRPARPPTLAKTGWSASSAARHIASRRWQASWCVIASTVTPSG